MLPAVPDVLIVCSSLLALWSANVSDMLPDPVTGLPDTDVTPPPVLMPTDVTVPVGNGAVDSHPVEVIVAILVVAAVYDGNWKYPSSSINIRVSSDVPFQ